MHIFRNRVIEINTVNVLTVCFMAVSIISI